MNRRLGRSTSQQGQVHTTSTVMGSNGGRNALTLGLIGLCIVVVLFLRDSGSKKPGSIPVVESVAGQAAPCPSIGQMRTKLLEKAQSKNIYLDTGDAVSHVARTAALKQDGATVWMTGLSGSGKSTIGKALERKLVLEDGIHMYRLDGDNLRFGISKDLTLSPEDRNEAVRRAGEVSLMMADAGVLSLVSLISPYIKDRDAARQRHEEANVPFIEVFVQVPLEVAQERDPKGLYAKAKRGEFKGMTGVDAPYEAPVNPEVTLETGKCCGVAEAEQGLVQCKARASEKQAKVSDECREELSKCADGCVAQLRDALKKRGFVKPRKGPEALTSGMDEAPGNCPTLPDRNEHEGVEPTPGAATGHADGFTPGTPPPNMVEPDESYWLSDAVTKLQPVPIRDVDVQWVQVIGEGWAAPLKGPMRESALVQALHFESLLVDTTGKHGGNSLYGPGPLPSEFGNSKAAAEMVRNGKRISMPIPITIAVNSHTKYLINKAIEKANGGPVQVVLVSPAGEPVAVLNDPEVYVFRKEEMITRSWGAWDLHHPYIKENIVEAGDYLLGGEFHKIRRIRYRDGLDRWRLTPEELIQEFKQKNADGVFAFQTRNPTHAGHAHLMKDGRNQLLQKGFSKPVLWLSPLGGWTKDDDVPLDIRVKQHQAVLDEKMLDPEWTVLAIWPSPMVYSGPTEVQWHAKSRRVTGADFFIVGRDPAGLTYSKTYASMHNQSKAGDVYDADHGRYVLQVSPGMGQMGLLASGEVHYDKLDGAMKPKPPGMSKKSPEFDARFLSISGSKMREMGRKGVDVCNSMEEIAADWKNNPNCVPPNFMVKQGWAIMRDYYKHKDDPEVKANAILQSKQIPVTAQKTEKVGSTKVGLPGGHFAVYLTDDEGKRISPWHDVPLKTGDIYNMVVEFPKGTNAKFEVQKELPHNPIKQDTKKGLPRYYTYGMSFFNNGLFPQTWEDSGLKDEEGNFGDNDPLDVMEIGSEPFPMGAVVPVKILGSLALVDSGETDWKVIAIAISDKDAASINDIASLREVKGAAFVDRIVDWLRMYKTTDKKDGSPNTFLKNAEYQSVADTVNVIEETSKRYQLLKSGSIEKTPKTKDFWLAP